MIMVSKDRIRKVEVAGLAGFLSAAKLLPTSPARCVRPGDRHRPHPQITQAQQNVSPQAHTDIPSSHSLTPTDGQRCAPQAHPSPPIPTIWIPIRPPRPPIPVEVRTHGGAHESLHLQAEPRPSCPPRTSAPVDPAPLRRRAEPLARRTETG